MDQPIRPTQEGPTPVEVTVVIPALNVANTIGEQLDGLAHQDFRGEWEVIVADNGSTDGTRLVVESFVDRLPSLRIVDASARMGINHARNAGTRTAHGKMILFCDGDDIVTPGWVRTMAEALHDYDGVGGRLHRFGRPDVTFALDPIRNNSTFLPYPIGANCGVRRHVWLSLGGFNEDYDGRVFDEVEFFWRLQLAGYRFGMAPDAIVRYRLPIKQNLMKSYLIGREAVRIDRDFRERGYPGAKVGALRAWGWIISRAPLALFSPTGRARWLRTLARHVGRAVGNVRYRHLHL